MLRLVLGASSEVPRGRQEGVLVFDLSVFVSLAGLLEVEGHIDAQHGYELGLSGVNSQNGECLTVLLPRCNLCRCQTTHNAQPTIKMEVSSLC